MPSPLAIALVDAADKPAKVLETLGNNPALAGMQDEHGYSLLHAAASYNHADLLRALVNQYHVDVDMQDEDGEAALFIVETIECAKILVEELNANLGIRAFDGRTARERIAEEGDYPQVATYLRMKELEAQVDGPSKGAEAEEQRDAEIDIDTPHALPKVPEGITVDLTSMDPAIAAELAEQIPDPEFRRRIEELATRPNFESDESQEELRAIITEAMLGITEGERGVRQRTH